MLLKVTFYAYLATNLLIPSPVLAEVIPHEDYSNPLFSPQYIVGELEDAIAKGFLTISIEEGIIVASKGRKKAPVKKRSLREFVGICAIQAFINIIT